MNEKPKLNFITYVFMMYQSGLMALGKIENPVTKKTAIELEEAKGVIELLEMLEEKTKGNLSDEEKKTLAMILDTLRYKYIEQAEGSSKESSRQTDKEIKPGWKKDTKDEEDIEIH